MYDTVKASIRIDRWVSIDFPIFTLRREAALSCHLSRKQREIAAQYDVGGETGHGWRFNVFDEVVQEDLEGQSSLCKRPLAESSQDAPRFDQRYKFRIKVRRYNLNFSQEALFVQCSKNRQTVGCIDINAVGVRYAAE